jgi:hypothetical protein
LKEADEVATTEAPADDQLAVLSDLQARTKEAHSARS